MNERFAEVLNGHLAKIQELNSSTHNSAEFVTWHTAVKLALGRCDDNWRNEFLAIDFYPTYIVGDSTAYLDSIYRSGLEKAYVLLKGCIDTLPLMSFEAGSANLVSPSSNGVSVTVNLNQTISQTQSQHIFNEIELEQYDPEIQFKVKELFEELGKSDKDKPKIKSIFLWLADKGADALTAIILHSTLGV